MTALTVPDTGNGSSVSATGLGIVTNVVSIDSLTIGATPVDISTLATVGYKASRPGDLREPVEVKWTYMWLGADPLFNSTTMIPTAEPYTGVAFTVTWIGAGTLVGKAFLKEVTTPSVANGEVMKGTATIVFDGSGGTNSPVFTAA